WRRPTGTPGGACDSSRFPTELATGHARARLGRVRRLGGLSLEAQTAARFIELGAADHDALIDIRRGAIGAIGGRAAHHANCERLWDVLRGGEKLGHGGERTSTARLVQPAH